MTINYADQIKIDSDNGFNVADKYKKMSLEGLQKVCKDESYPYAVCALNFTGDLNTGVVLRAASIMGADEFILFGRTQFDKRSTVGAHNYIPDFVKINGLRDDLSIDSDKFINIMGERKLVPIFIETDGISLMSVNWKKDIPLMYDYQKPCFIFGNESFGIPTELMNKYNSSNSMKISIPQKGVLCSLNVSSAASMILWDYVKHLMMR